MCRLIVNLCITLLMSALVLLLAIIWLSLLHHCNPSCMIAVSMIAVPTAWSLLPLQHFLLCCCHFLVIALSQLPSPSHRHCLQYHVSTVAVTITSSPWHLSVVVSVIALLLSLSAIAKVVVVCC